MPGDDFIDDADRQTFQQRDAGIDPPSGVSLILTNPPFGYRTSFGLDLDPFLSRFLATAHRALRPTLARFWEVGSEQQVVALINRLLREGDALPQLVRHDDFGWHIHATSNDAPLAVRMMVECAMSMIDVVRADGLDRLRRCAGDGCDQVLVDFSRNRSRRFCDAGCGNRANVAAYRARRRAAG